MELTTNTLYRNTINGLLYKKWTLARAIAYFIKGVARELHIAPDFFLKQYGWIAFKKYWNDEESCFDFCGAKLPDFSKSKEKLDFFCTVFEETFLIPCYFNDSYSKKLVERLDLCMMEGPYGYTDGAFDVSIKAGDVVIDAGAWIGDYSAYAASKGATVYAFEPVADTFQWLSRTQMLNNVKGGGKIHAIQKGLSDCECEQDIFMNTGSFANSLLSVLGDRTEKIAVTTLDKFVEDNSLERVDFIKSDIEGAERNMLRGATNVLKTFAPKLAVCTYHLPDDPQVLEQIIMEANPGYKVVHLRHKLFAAAVRQ